MKRKDHPNLKIYWYEDMKKDHLAVLKDICHFTGYSFTDAKLEELRDHLTIDSMRNVAVENSKKQGAGDIDAEFNKGFFRKGKVGDWKNYFQGEKAEEWDKWIKEQSEGLDVNMRFAI